MKAFLLVMLILVACTVPLATEAPTTTTDISDRITTPTITTLSTTQGQTTKSPTLNIYPTGSIGTSIPTDIPAKRSVFLISWDAGRADLIYGLMEQGKLPHFAQVAQQGVQAEYAISVDPSLTATAHNSLSTGCYPSKTGIVSNAYHDPSDSFYWYRNAFEQPMTGAEPIWVSASRAGLTTATLFFPGGAPQHPAQAADLTIGYGIRDAYSSQKVIELREVSEEWAGKAPISYSTPQSGSFTIPEVARVYISVLDSSDDNLANYDQVILHTQPELPIDTLPINIGEWGKLTLVSSTGAGASFLIQAIESDSSPIRVRLYHSGVYHNIAWPRALLEALNQRFGAFPAGADSYALEHGWINENDFMYLLEDASKWMAEVARWVYQDYRPDLIMTWQNDLDAAGHAFMLQGERQLNYSPENVSRYQDYYLKAAEVADQSLGMILPGLDMQDTTLILVSDHGMAPIHTTVYINTILQKAGLLKLDSRDYVVVDKTQAIGFASGGSAHIYINLLEREREGIVDNQDYAQVQSMIVDLFSSLQDPLTGEAVFQRVLRREDLDTIHLDHPNSGDVFIQAVPGYDLDAWRGKADIFEPAIYYGQHGYDCTAPEMRAIFIAAGAGIPDTGQIIESVALIDVAPTIAYLLDLDPLPIVDGNPILAITKWGK